MPNDPTIDLREGFRIEVEPLIMPKGEFAARLYRTSKSPSGRTLWKQIGHIVIASTPEKAAADMLAAMNRGLLPGVEVTG